MRILGNWISDSRVYLLLTIFKIPISIRTNPQQEECIGDGAAQQNHGHHEVLFAVDLLERGLNNSLDTCDGFSDTCLHQSC